jgi:hypothetical protein
LRGALLRHLLEVREKEGLLLVLVTVGLDVIDVRGDLDVSVPLEEEEWKQVFEQLLNVELLFFLFVLVVIVIVIVVIFIIIVFTSVLIAIAV